MSEAAEVRPDRNSLGKAAFVIGLIALLMSFVPIIGFVSWLLAPLAIIFGLIALRRASKSLAIAGIICGAIALFICFSWLSATEEVGKALNSDTFNNSGESRDLTNAPIVDASISGLWDEMENNKIAAGQKYGGNRLRFTEETIGDFGGTTENPSLRFEASTDGYIVESVSASFDNEAGSSLATLSKGDKVSFVCTEVSEAIMGGYSLSGCKLN